MDHIKQLLEHFLSFNQMGHDNGAEIPNYIRIQMADIINAFGISKHFPVPLTKPDILSKWWLLSHEEVLHSVSSGEAPKKKARRSVYRIGDKKTEAESEAFMDELTEEYLQYVIDVVKWRATPRNNKQFTWTKANNGHGAGYCTQREAAIALLELYTKDWAACVKTKIRVTL